MYAHSKTVTRHQNEKLFSLELKKYSIDIVALSETPLAGSLQPEEVEGCYVFVWSGKSMNESCQSDVGFAIQYHLARKLSSIPKGLS